MILDRTGAIIASNPGCSGLIKDRRESVNEVNEMNGCMRDRHLFGWKIFVVVFVVSKCQGRRAIQTMLGWDCALKIVDEG